MGINISSILAKSKEIYDGVCLQLIASDEIGQLVRIHYTPTWTPSSTPQFPSWGNANFNGTPNFSAGQTSQKQAEVTEEIRMRVYSTDSKGFGQSIFRQLGGAQYTQGQILTIGLMQDYGKVVDCVKADFYIATESVTGVKPYKLITDVRPHGFGKDTFFFCFWEKI